jgi:hypothetical protein
MHTADVSISYSSGSSLQLRMYSRGARAPAERVICAENGSQVPAAFTAGDLQRLNLERLGCSIDVY